MPIIKFICAVSLSVLAGLVGRVLFTGESFPVPVCESVTWIKGDNRESKGVKVVSPCSAGGVF